MKNTNLVLLLLYTALIASVMNGILFFYSQQRQIENTNDLMTTSEIVLGFTKLLSAVKDTETGQRGYIITQKAEYLQPFEQGLQDIKKLQSVLNSVIEKKYSEKKDILRDYLDKRIREIQQTLDYTKNNKRYEALKIIESGRGNDYMNKIREIFSQIEAQESGEQYIKKNWLREVLAFFAVVNITFVVFVVMVLIVSIFFLKKINNKNQSLVETLNNQNQILEKKVKERTLALEEINNELITADEELRQQNEEISQNNDYMVQNQIKLEQLNQAKDDILGIVAHDLRNPINAVFGLSNLINMTLEEVTLPPKKQQDVQEYITLIAKSCEKGNEIIQNILEVGELESPYFVLDTQPENLIKILENTIKLQEIYLQSKHITIDKKFEHTEIFAHVNKEKFARVMDNLLSNAIKFSFENSTIYLNIYQKNQNIIFSIQDEGIGISEDMQKILFDKFSKARRRGTKGEKSIGLGMSIIQKIVHLHHGNIWVNSVENKGSTFFVEIPA